MLSLSHYIGSGLYTVILIITCMLGRCGTLINDFKLLLQKVLESLSCETFK
jgi:hypothetical protein